ncbi:50S ribosomal protein L29 [Candidatus Peregrinibacteria bacterium]|nr:50S ribosomal protein L29 [Candidatus Peregrinibacteria bacterium]
MQKTSELRKLDTAKLRQELEKEKNSLFKTSFEVHNGQAKNSHEIRSHRRKIARLNTIIKEKQNEN